MTKSEGSFLGKKFEFCETTFFSRIEWFWVEKNFFSIFWIWRRKNWIWRRRIFGRTAHSISMKISRYLALSIVFQNPKTICPEKIRFSDKKFLCAKNDTFSSLLDDPDFFGIIRLCQFPILITLYHPAKNLRKLMSGSTITFCDQPTNQPTIFWLYAPLKWRTNKQTN